MDVTVPARVQNGRVISIDNAGKRSPHGGPSGTLFVTIAIRPEIDKDHLVIEQLNHLSTAIDGLHSPATAEPAVLGRLQNISDDIATLRSELTDTRQYTARDTTSEY